MKAKRLKYLFYFYIVLLVFTFSIVPANAIMLVSRAQEVSIGKQVEQDVIREYGGLSNDTNIIARVQKIGEKIASASPRKDVTYSYKVLKSNVINAFAAPGGPVLITEGLAKILTSDSELAFVLAHETGHIAAQHGRQAINRALLAQGLLSLLFRNSNKELQTGINVMYTLYDRGYSREQEYEADSYGVKLATAAGYNPEGAVIALAKLGLRRTTGINKYFATHPDVPDRIDRVAKQANISESRKKELIKQTLAEK